MYTNEFDSFGPWPLRVALTFSGAGFWEQNKPLVKLGSAELAEAITQLHLGFRQ